MSSKASPRRPRPCACIRTWRRFIGRQVEQLQHSLNHPEIRDEAVQILRGLIESVSIRPAKDGLEIEIVGEIAKMIELGIGPNKKQASIDERMARSVKVVAGIGFEPMTFRL
jgi:site-specific DNA recombinase